LPGSYERSRKSWQNLQRINPKSTKGPRALLFVHERKPNKRTTETDKRSCQFSNKGGGHARVTRYSSGVQVRAASVLNVVACVRLGRPRHKRQRRTSDFYCLKSQARVDTASKVQTGALPAERTERR